MIAWHESKTASDHSLLLDASAQAKSYELSWSLYKIASVQCSKHAIMPSHCVYDFVFGAGWIPSALPIGARFLRWWPHELWPFFWPGALSSKRWYLCHIYIYSLYMYCHHVQYFSSKTSPPTSYLVNSYDIVYFHRHIRRFAYQVLMFCDQQPRARSRQRSQE